MILIYINSFLFVLLFLFILYSYFPPTSSSFYTMILRNVSSIWENIQRRRLNLFLRIYHACDKSFSKVYSVIRWDIFQNSNQNEMFIREREGGGVVSPFRYQISYIIYIILTFVFIQIHTLIPITIFRMIHVFSVHFWVSR